MKKSKFTESQIIKALKENEQGRKSEEICRELGIPQGYVLQLAKEICRDGCQSIEGVEGTQG